MAQPPSKDNVLVRMTTCLVEELDKCGVEINNSFLSMSTTPQLDQLQSGNKIQLISRLSGRTLQLITNSSLYVDINANGEMGPRVFNAHWEVIRESKTLIRLHNVDNYLAIKDGKTYMVPYYDRGHAGPETLFTVSEVGAYVKLKSKTEPKSMLRVDNHGSILQADKTDNDESSQFIIQITTTSQYLTKQHSYPPMTSPRKDIQSKQRNPNSPSNAFHDLNTVNSHDDEPDRYWGD